jgi:hypothetical protein
MKRLLLALALLGVGLFAAPAMAQGPQPGQAPPTGATCNGVTVPAWVGSNRPSSPINGAIGFNLSSGYCETYTSSSASWAPTGAVASFAGGTVAGATSFSSTLAVTGAATFGGTLGVAGVVNTAAVAGFEQNGATLITGGTSAAPVTLAGLGAGASLNLATAAWEACFGYEACYSETLLSGENTEIGSVAGLLNVSGVQNTLIGSRVGGSFTGDSEVVCGGDDACRNTVGDSGVTGWGEGACRNGGSTGGSSNNVCIGFWALRGNAGSVSLSGTKTTGDGITLTFTFGGAVPYTLPGSPVHVTYTALAGDTLATITTGLINAINNSAALQAASPVQVTAYNTDPVNPQAFGVDFAGTALTGSKIVITSGVTGSATEVVTIGGGNSGIDNLAVGSEACLYAEATTAQLNICLGLLALAEQTAGVRDIAIGNGAAEFLTGGAESDNTLIGNFAGQGILGATYYNVVAVGDYAGNVLNSAGNVVLAGYKTGLLATSLNNSLVLGPQVGSTLALTGNNVMILGDGANAEPPTAGTSNWFGLFGLSTTAIMTATATNTATAAVTFPGGTVTVGVLGTQAGNLVIPGSTSGNITIAGGTTAASITYSVLPSGTAATYACFTAGGTLISSLAACP